jgi:enoyl-[acyl-carrier protein] reductase II
MPDSGWAAKTLDTALTRRLGIKYPIVQAGMGYIARQELAGAVSEAGALGVIGSTGNLTPDELRDEIREVKAITSKPFAVNLLFPRYDPELESARKLADELRAKIDVVLSEGVAVLGAGLGVPDPETIAAAHKAGTVVMCTIGATRHAAKAQGAGADILVAQGWEAGGHNSGVASMALLPQVCRVARVPVVAAGGFASGSGLIAALALGATGVYMGTIFAVSTEARAHDNYKNAVLAALDTSTVVTRAHSGKPARMVRNEFTRYYEEHSEEIKPFPIQWDQNEPLAVEVRVDGFVDRGPIPAGQIAGYLQGSESAKEIVERVISEARTVLTELSEL